MGCVIVPEKIIIFFLMKTVFVRVQEKFHLTMRTVMPRFYVFDGANEKIMFFEGKCRLRDSNIFKNSRKMIFN